MTIAEEHDIVCHELPGAEQDGVISRNIPCGVQKDNSPRGESPLIPVRHAGTTPGKKHLYRSVASRTSQRRCDAVMFNARAELEVRQKEHRI